MTDIFPGAKLVQLKQWGFPVGTPRPLPPASKAFSTVHITANLATAEGEAAWRSDGDLRKNSATFFVNRDGSIVQTLGDPLHMDPWANGDVRSPDLSNPRIAAMVRDGVNANERTLVAIENVGNEIAWGSVPGGHPITPAQEAANAAILAHYHALALIPVNRETVIGHYQLNSVTRPNCPARDKSVIDRIVAMASSEDDVIVKTPIRRAEWWTKIGPASTFTRSDGTQGHFTARERVTSIADLTLDDGTRGLLLCYGEKHEALVMSRSGADGPPITETLGCGSGADATCQAELASAHQTINAQADIIAEQKTRITAAKVALG